MKYWIPNEQVKSSDLNEGWFSSATALETLNAGDIVGYYFRKKIDSKTNSTSPSQEVRRDTNKKIGQTFTVTANLSYDIAIAIMNLNVISAGTGSYFQLSLWKTSGGLPTGTALKTWNMGTPVTGLNQTTSYGTYGGTFSSAGISNGDTLCLVVEQHPSSSSASAVALLNGNVYYNGSWASQSGSMGVDFVNLYYPDTTAVGKSTTSYLGTTPTAFAGIITVGGSANNTVSFQHTGRVTGLSNVSSSQYDYEIITFNSVVVGWKLPPDTIVLY